MGQSRLTKLPVVPGIDARLGPGASGGRQHHAAVPQYPTLPDGRQNTARVLQAMQKL